MAQVIESSRGKTLLIIGNYKFSKDKVLKNGEVYWRCVQKSLNCPAKVFTVGPEHIISRQNSQHNHQAKTCNLNTIISTSCNRKATNDISEKVLKIIRTELSSDLTQNFTAMDVARIRRKIDNCLRKLKPGSLPTNILEVQKFNPATANVVDSSKIESAGESIGSRSENLSFLDTASTSKISFIGDDSDNGSKKDIPDNLNLKFDSNEENLDTQMKFEVEYKPDISQLSYQHNIDNYCPADLDIKQSISKIVDAQRNIQMQDETDLFFASMAKIVRKLPEEERTLLRLQIGTLVSNAEIAYFSKTD